ncbi:MAG: hypothetical protein ACJA1A_000467 [Saprospiraceae bacterium]|jgi:hypothetical protein
MTILGLANFPFFFALLFSIYTFASFISIYFMLIQELTYHNYESAADILALVKTALLEPSLYHPKTVV